MAGKKKTKDRVWRLWVNTERRVVSFHQEPGFQLLEFRSRELYLSCVDRYTAQRYRYQ